MGGEGDKQNGDVRDRAVVLCRRQADHRGPLHGDCQESGEDPLHRSPLVIDELKSLCSVGDLITNGGGQPDEIIAALLTEELGMGGGAEQILPATLFPPVNGADILDVGSVLNGHLSPPRHFQIGGTGDNAVLDRKGCRGDVPAVSGDKGFGAHFGEDIGQDLLGVVVGVSDDAFRREAQPGGLILRSRGSCPPCSVDFPSLRRYPFAKLLMGSAGHEMPQA
jgi:hypothetical protein